MAHRYLIAFAALALFLAPLKSEASHYSLSDINLVSSKHVTSLFKIKITSTRHLLEATKTRKDRRSLAKTLKVKRKLVKEWAYFCDLLRIRGVGPRMARLLTAARTGSVKILRGQSAAALYKKIQAANAVKKITENLPGEGHLKHWIAQAKKLEIVVKD